MRSAPVVATAAVAPTRASSDENRAVSRSKDCATARSTCKGGKLDRETHAPAPARAIRPEAASLGGECRPAARYQPSAADPAKPACRQRGQQCVKSQARTPVLRLRRRSHQPRSSIGRLPVKLRHNGRQRLRPLQRQRRKPRDR